MDSAEKLHGVRRAQVSQRQGLDQAIPRLHHGGHLVEALLPTIVYKGQTSDVSCIIALLVWTQPVPVPDLIGQSLVATSCGEQSTSASLRSYAMP